MKRIDEIRERLPEEARDIAINLGNVLAESSLSLEQRWGVAIATAIAARSDLLVSAVTGDARDAGVSEATIEDARAAAVMMGMTNIYYRFRHLAGKDAYNKIPARLRMQRVAKPRSTRLDFELFSLAVSAINGCESCVRSHEHGVIEAGLTEAQVNDAIRIAATMHATAIGLEVQR